MQNQRFVHLDFKGIAPCFDKVHEWLLFLKGCGFSGIVFEFDCRVRWKTWPLAGMPVYSPQEAAAMVADAEKLGFETIPLMQIQGHLEWILGEKAYAGLRENGKLTLCPSSQEARKKLAMWMCELRKIFPHSRYIHLGADEVDTIGECPNCRKKLQQVGRFGIYMENTALFCKKALAMGFRPLIWADMILQEQKIQLETSLPPETILVNWQYCGSGPFHGMESLQKSGFEVWGASSIKSFWHEHPRMLLNYPQDRLINVAGWNQFEGNVIHTFWGRPGNKGCLYPPWPMSVPVFIAAGNPDCWRKHPWHDKYQKFGDCLRRNNPPEIQDMIRELDTWPCASTEEKECVTYLQLGLRYELLFARYCSCRFSQCATDASIPFVGKNPSVYHEHFCIQKEKIQEELDILMEELADFFTRNGLIGKEEFIAEKRSIFLL